jgi:hypothetical protein
MTIKLLTESRAVAGNLHDEAERHGLSRERLVFAANLVRAEHLAIVLPISFSTLFRAAPTRRQAMHCGAGCRS